MAFKVNDILKEYFLSLNVKLVDFKLEFGRLTDGTIVLADEISPDTCRFWDADTNEKLDKDRFRRDMGGVEDAYQRNDETSFRQLILGGINEQFKRRMRSIRSIFAGDNCDVASTAYYGLVRPAAPRAGDPAE